MRLGQKLSKLVKEDPILDDQDLYDQLAKENAASLVISLDRMMIKAAREGFNSLKYTTSFIPGINTIMMRLIKAHFDKQHVSSKIYSYVDFEGLDNTGVEFWW